MIDSGKTRLELDYAKQTVTLTIECLHKNKQEIYDEKYINEVSSRVFIENNSILKIFCNSSSLQDNN